MARALTVIILIGCAMLSACGGECIRHSDCPAGKVCTAGSCGTKEDSTDGDGGESEDSGCNAEDSGPCTPYDSGCNEDTDDDTDGLDSGAGDADTDTDTDTDTDLDGGEIDTDAGMDGGTDDAG